ncbi:MAG: TIGR03862 family flavoprotein [Pseudomonadota bacterium]
MERVRVGVIGAGPAGLAAAESLAEAGETPVIFEAMPSPARKLLMAGKSGLNLTKDTTAKGVIDAIGCTPLDEILKKCGPREVMSWAETLGEALFTGSSRRVFPVAMKASPLLRRWFARLTGAGVTLRTRWGWRGWEDNALIFETPHGPRIVMADAVVLALGGASWPRLGSDAAWVTWLEAAGVEIAPFRPANMGFDIDWSPHFAERFAGQPVKGAALSVGSARVTGEFVVSRTGIEGSAVYAISSPLRDSLEKGPTTLTLDLTPGQSLEALMSRLARPRGKSSLSNHLRKSAGLTGVRAGLLREGIGALTDTPEKLAERIKSLTLHVARPRPIAEAISSAGGIAWGGVDAALMLRARPGTFVAGEMLDWEAPTGGYLLTACLATGWHAGRAAADLLAHTTGSGQAAVSQ